MREGRGLSAGLTPEGNIGRVSMSVTAPRVNLIATLVKR